MTPVPATRFRLDPGILLGLAWRLGIVVAATAAVVAELPAWVRAPLSVAALVVTVVFVLRRSQRRGRLDRALTAMAVVVATLALLGLLLSVLPSGISTVSWGLGVGVLEAAALLGFGLRRAPDAGTWPRLARVPLAAAVWTVLAAGVLAGALVWSIASFTATHVAPLALAAVPSEGAVVVTLSSGSDDGPFELHVVSESGRRAVLVRDLRVGPDEPVSITLDVPADVRGTLQLVRAGTDTPLRELILDTTAVTE